MALYAVASERADCGLVRRSLGEGGLRTYHGVAEGEDGLWIEQRGNNGADLTAEAAENAEGNLG